MSSPKARLAWPDIAKGVSILGVVLLHVTLTVPESSETRLAALNLWLDPLRLPLFFLVSGYFSTKVFNFTFPQLFARRLWYFIVPYVVWMAVELQVKRLELHWVFESDIFDRNEMLFNMVFGHTMAWFIHSLIFFNIFLWCVRKLPGWLAVLLSFTPLLFMAWQAHFTFIAKAMMFLPMFVAAAFFRDWITRFASEIEAPFKGHFGLSTAFFYGGTIVAYLCGSFFRRAWDSYPEEVFIPWPLPGAEYLTSNEVHILVRFVEQALEVPLGIVLAIWVSYVPVLSKGLRFIGSHTLPIYLAHPIGLTVGYGFFMAWFPHEVTLHGEHLLDNTWFWLIACFVFAAIASLALWALGRVPIVGWLLKPPDISHLIDAPAQQDYHPENTPPEITPRQDPKAHRRERVHCCSARRRD